MYLLFAILLPLFLLLFILNHRRRKKNIQKVCTMCMSEKCKLLSELTEPFGYAYVPSQDIFTTRIDAWQREFGYCALYDKAAVRFGMVFDSLPVYFNYQGRTWLLEFWKGQYGINTGGEIGLYYADRILEENELATTLFQAVEDADMIRMSFSLSREEEKLTKLAGRHWWLTAFRMGTVSNPSDLIMNASVTFPSADMAMAFVSGLRAAGCSADDICRNCCSVSLTFAQSVKRTGFFRRLRIRFAQWKNRFWCRMFLSVTRPFSLSVDRILYLYYYLPFAFRRTLRIRRYKKRRPKQHRSGRCKSAHCKSAHCKSDKRISQ